MPSAASEGPRWIRTGRRRPVSRFGIAACVGLLAIAFVLPGTVGAAVPAASGSPVKVIVQYKREAWPGEKQALKDIGGKVRHAYTLIDGVAATVPANAIGQLRRDKRVKSVEIDGTVTTMEPVTTAATTGDLEYDNAWGVTHIGSKAAHDAGIRGQGVKVAVIDTGVDYIHDQPPALEPPVVDPEFLNIYKGGYDFVNNDADPMDDNGHGTHVAGILAAEHNGYLVVGVAPAVDLYALKILDASGSGDVSNLILALQWAVDHGINVANMSLGTHEISPALATAVANASAAGLSMVAAAGNITTITELFQGCPITYPGAYPQVLSTTFTNENDALTGYSCTGPEDDFAAPGDNIFSPVPVGSCMLCSPNGYARRERDVDGVTAPGRHGRAAAQRRDRGRRRTGIVRRRSRAPVRDGERRLGRAVDLRQHRDHAERSPLPELVRLRRGGRRGGGARPDAAGRSSAGRRSGRCDGR